MRNTIRFRFIDKVRTKAKIVEDNIRCKRHNHSNTSEEKKIWLSAALVVFVFHTLQYCLSWLFWQRYGCSFFIEMKILCKLGALRTAHAFHLIFVLVFIGHRLMVSNFLKIVGLDEVGTVRTGSTWNM